jgi:hypothetical protein
MDPQRVDQSLSTVTRFLEAATGISLSEAVVATFYGGDGSRYL